MKAKHRRRLDRLETRVSQLEEALRVHHLHRGIPKPCNIERVDSVAHYPCMLGLGHIGAHRFTRPPDPAARPVGTLIFPTTPVTPAAHPPTEIPEALL